MMERGLIDLTHLTPLQRELYDLVEAELREMGDDMDDPEIVGRVVRDIKQLNAVELRQNISVFKEGP